MMAAPVLVAYATRYGSTQEVAEAVAETLREGGLTVDLQPVREVRALEEYRAVVLGAPIYMGHLHKDADAFLSRYREDLAELPMAFFALGPTYDPYDEEEWQGVHTQLDQELAKYSWLTPVALELFGGKYDPSKLGFSHRLLSALPASPLHGLPASDMRDWEAIRAWAGDLAQKLQAALS